MINSIELAELVELRVEPLYQYYVDSDALTVTKDGVAFDPPLPYPVLCKAALMLEFCTGMAAGDALKGPASREIAKAWWTGQCKRVLQLAALEELIRVRNPAMNRTESWIEVLREALIELDIEITLTRRRRRRRTAPAATSAHGMAVSAGAALVATSNRDVIRTLADPTYRP